MAGNERLLPRRRLMLSGLACLVASPLALADDGFGRPPSVPEASALDWLRARPTIPTIGRRGSDSSSGGLAAGDLAIVEFMDYRCAFCRAMQPTLARLLVEFPSLTIGVAEWPVYGDVSTYAARLALIAARHGLFRPIHDALFAAKASSRTAVLAAAISAGLPPNLVDDKGSIAWADVNLGAVRRDAAAMALKGTPTLLIGTKVIRGALSHRDLHDLLAAEGAGSLRKDPAR